MHIRRRISYRDETPAHFSSEPVSFWLRSRRWDFWVANELEAFAVIARHDIEYVEAVTVQTNCCESVPSITAGRSTVRYAGGNGQKRRQTLIVMRVGAAAPIPDPQ